MRIVLISTERSWRGGESQLALLAEGVLRRGHALAVVAQSDGELARRLAAGDCPLHPLRGRGRSPGAILRFHRFLREFRPDVIHANDAHALTCVGLASPGCGAKGRVASRRAMFPIRWPVRYRALCDRVICISQAVSETCRGSGLASEQLRVVYDGVDPQRIAAADGRRARRSLDISDDRLLIVTAAALTEEKGHATLLAAAPQVVERYPKAVFALAGDGVLRDELRRQAKMLCLDDHVRFLGFRDNVLDLIQAADMFVMPSHAEGLGSVLIEAMLAGRPIVATTAGGIPELLGNDGEEPAAWMAPPQDAEKLAAAMLECLASPQEQRRRGRCAHERALARFTADRMVEQTLEVYSEVMNTVPERAKGERPA